MPWFPISVMKAVSVSVGLRICKTRPLCTLWWWNTEGLLSTTNTRLWVTLQLDHSVNSVLYSHRCIYRERTALSLSLSSLFLCVCSLFPPLLLETAVLPTTPQNPITPSHLIPVCGRKGEAPGVQSSRLEDPIGPSLRFPESRVSRVRAAVYLGRRSGEQE